MLRGRKAYTHGEGTAEVIEDDPGTRVARMIHFVLGCKRKNNQGEAVDVEVAVESLWSDDSDR